MGAKAVAQFLYNAVKVRAHPVHLVDESNAGNVITIRLPPNGFALWLHSAHGAKHCDHPVQYS